MKTSPTPRSAMKAPVLSLVFMAHCAFAPRLCGQAEPPEFPPILPQWRLDTLAAADGTHHRCLVFTARPGVLYTVEFSPDLIQWTEDSTIYGMGHEFVTAMARTAAPAAAPPPGGNPPPASGVARRVVSLRLSPSSGAAGGTVVSWPSLDGSREARVALIPETLVASWALMPLYVNGFGNHEFFIAYSGSPSAPPDPDPELSAGDAAMLAALRENLPAINQQVAASVARSINSPAPAPPDPDGRRFWRIRADRSPDSDGDGVPDWLEFFLAAGPDGDSMADAFVRDTDNDGVKDGYQIDSDRDGLPDLVDPDPRDGDIGTSDPAERFAVFPIAARTDPEGGALAPLMINGQGTVLYQDAWWKHGEVTPLVAENSGHVSGCSALSINDSGHILGMGLAQRQPAAGGSGGPGGTGGSMAMPLVHCWWSAPDATPVPVEADGRFALPAPRVRDSPDSLATADPFPFDSLLSALGYFMADRAHDTDPAARVRALWSAASGGFTRNEAAGNAYSAGGFDPVFVTEGLLERIVFGPAGGGSRLMTPSQSHDLAMDMRRLRITATPNEIFEVACGSGTGTHVYRAGRWRTSQALANATDIGHNSLRLARIPAADGGPAADGVAQDARVFPWPRWAPGLTGAAASPANVNRADSGWALGRLSNGGAQACMPVSFSDADASGTDTESLRGFPWEPPLMGAQEKCWVMVPKGGPANSFTLRSLAIGGNVLRVTAPGMEWSGGGETAEFRGSAVSESLVVDAASGIASGTAVDLEINLGTRAAARVDSLSTPLAGYVMKERVVRVRPIRVINTTGGGNNGPDLAVTAAALKAHLDAIFRPQINVTFEVEDPVDLPIAWDTGAADGILDLDNEVAGMLEQTAATADDIRLFLIGSDHLFTVVETGERNNGVSGYSYRKDPENVDSTFPNVCWVLADGYEGRTAEHLLGTIGHEIGHVIVGDGHPDDPKFYGKARLPGTDHRKRLMVSGFEVGGGIRTGKVLVKGEWEEAELWLKEEIDKKKQ